MRNAERIFDVVFQSEMNRQNIFVFLTSRSGGALKKSWDSGDLYLASQKLGDRGLVDNWFYEHEMMLILFAFEKGEPIPQLPVELGTNKILRPQVFLGFCGIELGVSLEAGMFIKRPVRI